MECLIFDTWHLKKGSFESQKYLQMHFENIIMFKISKNRIFWFPVFSRYKLICFVKYHSVLCFVIICNTKRPFSWRITPNFPAGWGRPSMVRAKWTSPGGWLGGGVPSEQVWTDPQTHDWKYYLPATSLVGDKNHVQPHKWEVKLSIYGNVLNGLYNNGLPTN